MEVLLQHGKLVFVLVSTLISLISLFFALKAEAKYKKLYRQFDYFMRGKDAILNYDNSGFIFNSVHAKEGGFLYIKEVEEGSTSVELGAEEKLALEEALGYRKKPQT